MFTTSDEYAAAVAAPDRAGAEERARHLGLDFDNGYARCPVDGAPLESVEFRRGEPTIYRHLSGSCCSSDEVPLGWEAPGA